MTIFIENESWGYELQRVAQLFCFGQTVAVKCGILPDDFTGEALCAYVQEDRLVAAARFFAMPAHAVHDGDAHAFCPGESYSMLAYADKLPDDDLHALEHKFGVLFYGLLSRHTGLSPEWGVLTGVRPVKLFLARMEEGMDAAKLRRHFIEDRLVSERRFSLAYQTAQVQRPLLARHTPDSFSLYVSIPFCPSRCAYCSFVSHSVEKAAKLMPAYVDCLCEELAKTAHIANDLRLKLRCIYFGGGTPTTLSAGQLSRVMDTIAHHFDLSDLWEYTVEAGRPDTITEEKLRAIQSGGAGRVSINPQTLNDRVLQAVGRRHTVAQALDCYELARKIGFSSINMDLIAGLPQDTPESFQRSMDGILSLAPENVTVHTLTVKRAAALTPKAASEELRQVGGMVDYAREKAAAAGYFPYYLYRQSGSLSALENVGYAKPGKEGLYNIYIMDESHTILAVGAGASTKLCNPAAAKVKRIYNYKYPYEYISRFEEAVKRKQTIREFFAIPGGFASCNL